MIVGMGKLGGHELNASSDIDLIYVTDEDGLTSGRPDGGGEIESHLFFTKLGRRMAQLLGEITADGCLSGRPAAAAQWRLRAHGLQPGHARGVFDDPGSRVERYAWVKARVVNQPVFSAPDAFQTLVDSLEDIRRPFVFRRYLDFNALAALRDLHQQIREEAKRRGQRRESRMAGEFEPVDIKLGPGGIREVEFVANSSN